MRTRQLPRVTDRIESGSDVTDSSLQQLLFWLFIDANWYNCVRLGL